MKQPLTHSGQCLCGMIRFEIAGPLEPVQICHCAQCRRAQGTPFASNIPVKSADISWLSGQDHLSRYESSPGKCRYFCPTCGSPVYSSRDSLPDVIRLRAGLLDNPVASQPLAHFYTGSKASWWTISDGLPQFEAAYIPPPQTKDD